MWFPTFAGSRKGHGGNRTLNRPALKGRTRLRTPIIASTSRKSKLGAWNVLLSFPLTGGLVWWFKS